MMVTSTQEILMNQKKLINNRKTNGIIKWQNVKIQALNGLRLRNDQEFIPRVQIKRLSYNITKNTIDKVEPKSVVCK